MRPALRGSPCETTTAWEAGWASAMARSAPAIHTGQDWQLAYIWVCRDMAAYGAADQYFSDAVARMDPAKVSQDFNAVFDGSKHRDELWRAVEMR